MDRRHALPSMRTFQRTLERTRSIRWTRSTCCSAPTSCRSTRGWAPTTSACSSGRRARRPMDGGVLGARSGVHAGGALAGDAAPDGPLPGDPGEVGRGEENPELEASLPSRCASAARPPRRDLDDGLPRSKEQWGWNWSNTAGSSTSSGRPRDRRTTSQFEVLYDLPERVIPGDPAAADAEPRGRQPGAGASGRGYARGHGAVPARLLPDAHPARAARDRRAGRGG